jgi:Asp/Glu/hydantoin racemase
MASPNVTRSERSLAAFTTMMGEYTRMAESKRRIAFIHTSPPAIQPLMQYYSSAAPDLQIVNLLEDGLLGMLADGFHAAVHVRLRNMIEVARETYAAELAVVTCSSVPLGMALDVGGELRMPVLKIDGPMARKAVEAGSRVGIAVTFPPTINPTSRLLTDIAGALGREIQLETRVIAGAYDALLAGDTATHDRLLLEGIRELAESGVDSVVLAQVSMARVREEAQKGVKVPVLSSLDTSLSAVREVLEGLRGGA